MQLKDLFQILAYILNCKYSVSTILKMPVNHLKFVSFGRSSIHYSCVPYTQGRQLFQNSSSSANITSVNHLDIVIVIQFALTEQKQDFWMQMPPTLERNTEKGNLRRSYESHICQMKQVFSLREAILRKIKDFL